jgi:diaminopimelate epimerase
MIDDRSNSFVWEPQLIKQLCYRHFGIGADGLILLQDDKETDFKMVYFNSDGNQSTMCGNGGRCIVKFAEELGIIKNKATFTAVDGIHEALIINDLVELKIANVSEVQIFENHYFLNTGSPHHIEFVENVEEVDVKNSGKKIRFGAPYFEEGSNVNFVEILNENSLKIRTYERGVEDETLACGTGITAAAIAGFESGKLNSNEINIESKGGNLKVKFTKNESGGYENIWLIGPAEKVFEGEIELR